jgi:hypothetical protein
MPQNVIVMLPGAEEKGDHVTRGFLIQGFCLKEVFAAYKRLAEAVNEGRFRGEFTDFDVRSPFPDLKKPLEIYISVRDTSPLARQKAFREFVEGPFEGLTVPEAYIEDKAEERVVELSSA